MKFLAKSIRIILLTNENFKLFLALDWAGFVKSIGVGTSQFPMTHVLLVKLNQLMGRRNKDSTVPYPSRCGAPC